MNEMPSPSLSPVQQFLSDLVRESLKSGLHTPTELVEHFPPDAIMSLLADEPDKRARILIEVFKYPAKAARALPAPHAGAMLQTAFDAEEATPQKIVSALDADDVALHFPPVALWAYLEHGEWWKKPKADKTQSKEYAITGVGSMWRNGLTDFVKTIDRLEVQRLARWLPKDLLELLFEDAVKSGLRKLSFDAERVFHFVTVSKLVNCVPLEAIHDSLFVTLAEETGLLNTASKSETADEDEEHGPATRAATPLGRSSRPPKKPGDATCEDTAKAGKPSQEAADEGWPSGTSVPPVAG